MPLRKCPQCDFLLPRVQRKANVYNEFVRATMSSDDVKLLPADERFLACAKLWAALKAEGKTPPPLSPSALTPKRLPKKKRTRPAAAGRKGKKKKESDDDETEASSPTPAAEESEDAQTSS